MSIWSGILKGSWPFSSSPPRNDGSSLFRGSLNYSQLSTLATRISRRATSEISVTPRYGSVRHNRSISAMIQRTITYTVNITDVEVEHLNIPLDIYVLERLAEYAVGIIESNLRESRGSATGSYDRIILDSASLTPVSVNDMIRFEFSLSYTEVYPARNEPVPPSRPVYYGTTTSYPHSEATTRDYSSADPYVNPNDAFFGLNEPSKPPKPKQTGRLIGLPLEEYNE